MTHASSYEACKYAKSAIWRQNWFGTQKFKFSAILMKFAEFKKSLSFLQIFYRRPKIEVLVLLRLKMSTFYTKLCRCLNFAILKQAWFSTENPIFW